jgi:uncharacterized protein YlxP (DUF503 family)
MRVGLLTLSFRLHAVGSIKEKRSIVKRVLADVDRSGAAFAACEVSNHERLDLLTVRVAHVSNDARHTDAALRRLQERLDRGKDHDIIEAEVEFV